MKKLDEIRIRCQETVDEWDEIKDSEIIDSNDIDKGRAELAEEILEILNGEIK